MMGRGVDKSHYCTVCGKTGARKEVIQKHVEANHIADHPGIACDLCGVVCKTRASYGMHRYTKHRP